MSTRKLYFTWTLDEEVQNMEDIKEIKIQHQQDKLNYMLKILQEKIKAELVGVKIDHSWIKKCNGIYENKNCKLKEYHINNRMNIIISKKGRKSTWDDVYRVINAVQAAKYRLL